MAILHAASHDFGHFAMQLAVGSAGFAGELKCG
jgi:hypothetical protein